MPESIGNSGFQSFQMDSTQSPFCAINAAYDALVALPKVTGVNAEDFAGNIAPVTEGGSVHPTATLNIAFPGAVDAATASKVNIKLYKGLAVVPTTVEVSEDDSSIIVVDPTSNLVLGADYKLVVSKAVTVGGVALASDYTLNFSATDQASVTNVAYTGVNPFVSGSNILPADTDNGVFTLTYNASLDAATVSTSTVKVYNLTDSEYVGVTVAYVPANKQITVTLPNTQLDPSTKYEVRVNGVKDLASAAAESATVVFTVGTSAQATIVTPSADDIADGNVYPFLTSDSSIGKLGFSLLMTVAADINDATITSDTVYLQETDTDAKVEATVTADKAAGTITLVPKAALKESTDYTVVFDGATDQIGIELTAPAVVGGVTFTTGDYSRPVVESASIQDGAAVATDEELSINFNEPITQASIAGGASDEFTAAQSAVLLNLSTDQAINLAGNFTFGNDDKTVTFDLDGLLNEGDSYKLLLSGKNNAGHLAVQDASANLNKMASTYELTFYVEADTAAPTIKEVAGKYIDGSTYILTNGATNVAAQIVKVRFNEEDLAPVGATALSSTSKVRVYNVTDSAYVTGGTFQVFDGATNPDGTSVKDYLNISANSFTAGNTYRIDLTSGIEDIAGNKLVAKSYTLTFGEGENIALTTPANLTSADIETNIVMTVANLDTSTLNSTNVKLQKVSDSTVVAGALTYAAGAITFNPTADLEKGTQYNVVVSGLKDQDGNLVVKADQKPATINYLFETEPALIEVASTSVTNGQINVDRSKAITVDFTDDMAFNSANLNIALTQAGNPVATTLSNPTDDTDTVKVAFNSTLTAYTDYVLTVTLYPTTPDEDVTTIHFTTGNTSTDLVAPVPTVADAQIGPAQDIVVNFDKAMKTSTFNTTNVKLFNVATNEYVGLFSSNLTYTSTQLTINPSANLASGGYVLILTTGVQDTNGNALAEEFNATITVEANPAITLTADTTANTVDGNIDITFVDNAAWRAAVTGVTYNGAAIAPAAYAFSAGHLILDPSLDDDLQTAGTANVVVTANGYVDSTVAQTLLVGAVDADVSSFVATGTVSAPGVATYDTTVTVKDQYGNAITGLATGAFAVGTVDSVTITKNAFTAVGNGVYTVQLSNTADETETIDMTVSTVALTDTIDVTWN